jgi:non-ribosomal peptide synthetase component F
MGNSADAVSVVFTYRYGQDPGHRRIRPSEGDGRLTIDLRLVRQPGGGRCPAPGAGTRPLAQTDRANAADYITGYTFLTMCPAARVDTVSRWDQPTGSSADWQQGGRARHVASLNGDKTVTQRLVAVAAAYGCRPALVGPGPDQAYSFADLATTIQRAAAGLAWRGLRPGDVVGVYVPDAACYVLACHAISAAGGIPCPVSAQLSIAETAGQLADCGARMLLTAPPLAAAGLAAADRSWVRQVISFTDAPAATPFGSLLGMGSMQPPTARPHDLALLPYVRRADGTLHPAGQTHLDMAAELAALTGAADVSEHDVVLAAPPAGDGRSYSAFIDHALLHGATIVAAWTDELSAAANAHRGTAAIVPLGVEVHAAEPVRLFAVAF